MLSARRNILLLAGLVASAAPSMPGIILIYFGDTSSEPRGASADLFDRGRCGSLAAGKETLLLAAIAILTASQNRHVRSLSSWPCWGLHSSQPLLLLERLLLDLRTAR